MGPDHLPRHSLLTWLISVPFIIETIVAILSTRISLYLVTSPLPLAVRVAQVFWTLLGA
jgi:hypothetical protein